MRFDVRLFVARYVVLQIFARQPIFKRGFDE
jgi:hypothetical protein